MKKYYILGLIGITTIAASSYMAYKYYPQYKLYQANKELKDKHYAEAANKLTQLCNEGLGDACYELSTLYTYGKGVEANEDKVEKLLQKACDLNSSDGCFTYGEMKYKSNFEVLFGQQDIPITKIEEVFKIDSEPFLQACELGNSNACTVTAMFYSSESIKKDINKENEFKTKAKKYLNSSIERYKQGCDNGIADQCNNLIMIYSDDFFKNQKESRNFWSKRDKLLKDDCNAGFINACIAVGDDEKACSKNNGEGCNNLGHRYEYDNKQRSLHFFTKSCDLNYAKGCTSLGFILDDINGQKSNDQTAIIYAKGCELGDSLSCSMIGHGYLSGYKYLNSKNVEKAIRYFKKGCELKEGANV